MWKLGGIGLAIFLAALLASSAISYLAVPKPSATAVPELGADAASPTDRQIGALQERLRQHPTDQPAATALGLAYLQRTRETGDPS
jgi:cytochrome c-type biogenesis protein CcmH/NrfG